MCEFCTKYGEGEKWYLRAQNYSEDLLSDLRRRKFILDFFEDPDKLGQDVDKIDDLNKLPSFVRSVVKSRLIKRFKRDHYGQVVPIEEVEQIFKFVTSVIRLPCICRQATVGTEQRYCYGISMVPTQKSQMAEMLNSLGADYLSGPHTSGLEALSKEEALEQIRRLEHKSLFHSVWTFVAPFIGGICNCDLDCLAMRLTSIKSFPVMFRAEYVAVTEPELCNGCRHCMHSCQFGAIRYSLAQGKIDIDPLRCYGCGICRATCSEKAILLKDRCQVPVAAGIW